jgi:hypothetical protein
MDLDACVNVEFTEEVRAQMWTTAPNPKTVVTSSEPIGAILQPASAPTKPPVILTPDDEAYCFMCGTDLARKFLLVACPSHSHIICCIQTDFVCCFFIMLF